MPSDLQSARAAFARDPSGPDALHLAERLLRSIDDSQPKDLSELQRLDEDLESTQSGVLEFVRCRLRLAILEARLRLDIPDAERRGRWLRSHSGELRRWLWALSAPSGDPNIDLFRGSVEMDIEDELARVHALLSHTRPDDARDLALPSLLDGARRALHGRYAFGASPPGEPRRLVPLRHPAIWAVVTSTCVVAAWFGWTPGLAIAVAAPLIAATVLITAARDDLLLTFVPRLGAAVAVGAAPLALTDEFWRLALTTEPSRALAVSAALLALAAIYLALEVRSRGVRRAPRVFARTVELLVAAVAYAALISHAIVAIVGPSAISAYASSSVSPAFAACRSVEAALACAVPSLYALFAASSLTLGVLLQLLWEERPMTSRL